MCNSYFEWVAGYGNRISVRCVLHASLPHIRLSSSCNCCSWSQNGDAVDAVYNLDWEGAESYMNAMVMYNFWCNVKCGDEWDGTGTEGAT